MPPSADTQNVIEPGIAGAYRRMLPLSCLQTHGRVIMLLRPLFILVGFALASFTAAATLVLFVYAPGDLASLRTDLNGTRLSEAGYFALVITPWVAVTGAVPALAGILYAEARKIAGWTFYALAGLGTALVGFFLQRASEPRGEPGIFEAYALIAFLAAGLVGGLVYWASSGRYASRAGGAAPKPS
jgi:hypothetical protein